MERFIEVEPGVRLWAEESGDPHGESLLLVMGANAAGLAWSEELVAALGREHRVIRYDHRDTGRSSRVFHQRPYPVNPPPHAEHLPKVISGARWRSLNWATGMPAGGCVAEFPANRPSPQGSSSSDG